MHPPIVTDTGPLAKPWSPIWPEIWWEVVDEHGGNMLEQYRPLKGTFPPEQPEEIGDKQNPAADDCSARRQHALAAALDHIA